MQGWSTHKTKARLAVPLAVPPLPEKCSAEADQLQAGEGESLSHKGTGALRDGGKP
jgi:hypothetical protein